MRHATRSRLRGLVRLLAIIPAAIPGMAESPPVISFSTYLGGNGATTAAAAATDSSGNVYVTGWTSASDLPGLYVGILGRDADFGGWLFQRNAFATNKVHQISLVTNYLFML